MPKLKTNKGVAKRFSFTAKGKIKRRRSGLRHILTKKSAKRKRRLASPALVAATDTRAIKRLLPYG
ncbi:MAG TPA: 50S ribosomal protein L35 [Deltaproteobacteria bacterium]|nr:50S ribosomal protein L35 [Deltaproteobacteria bacterium]